jgi:alpha-L-fucosidase
MPTSPSQTLVSLPEYQASIAASRDQRMGWWRRARYGMFIHFGLYSLLGRHEQVQITECIPDREYARLARRFRPEPGCARSWAALARRSGMKYVVFTAKHHDGFCLWDTAQTTFSSVATGGRDLVAEHVAACREAGLKVGLYYSLLDCHHPDGARSAYDPEARRRFIDYTHACVQELMTRYGRIDVLWYDVARPFQHHEGWETLALNQIVRSLQPHIIINERGRLEEDYTTPEESIPTKMPLGRDWEACKTMNGFWSWMPSADCDTLSPRDIVGMLGTVSSGGGNLLLNIGPKPDGSIPEASSASLLAAGQWLKRHRVAVQGDLDRGIALWGATACGLCTVRGNRVYLWCRHWPAPEMGLGGFGGRLVSAQIFGSDHPLRFRQKGWRIELLDLPIACPDPIAGTGMIELRFDGPPGFVFRPLLPHIHV